MKSFPERTSICFKESGCVEGSVDSPKCWHFVRVTRDFGFQQGAFDTNSSNRIVTSLVTLFMTMFVINF